MRRGENHDVTLSNRWTSRIAVFSFVVLITAAVLHRVGLATAIALNLTLAGISGMAVALLLGLIGVVGVWRYGDRGASRAVVGMGLAMLVFAALGAVAVTAKRYPPINDISTDLKLPPEFVELAKLRGGAGNPAAYPTAFAAKQAAHFPDLKTLEVPRSFDEMREIAGDVARRLHYRVVQEDPSGLIEAEDRTLIFGFYDDIAIRVRGDDKSALVDVRSASRFGLYDFGHNAVRVRKILRDIVARLEETVPTADGERVPSLSKQKDKDEKDDDAKLDKGQKKKPPSRSAPDRAP
jgi:uncharacterized protein (DUF1499 family)